MNLFQYEDIIELNLAINADKAIAELREIENWKSQKTRKYIDLLGDVDQSYKTLSGNSVPNEVLEQCPTIKDFVLKFPDAHKARVQRMDTGSFFEPHRDHFQGGKRFRVFCALNNTEMENYVFFHNGKIFEFKPGVAYIINTARVHGSMSFADETYHLLLSVDDTADSSAFVQNKMRFA